MNARVKGLAHLKHEIFFSLLDRLAFQLKGTCIVLFLPCVPEDILAFSSGKRPQGKNLEGFH